MRWRIFGRAHDRDDHDRGCPPRDGDDGGGVRDDCSGIPAEWLPRLCDDSAKLLGNGGDKAGPIPCITVDERRYARLADAIKGRAVSIDTNLNIFHDDARRVFVEIVLDVPINSAAGDGDGGARYCDGSASDTVDGSARAGTMQERFILNARRHLPFFEALARSSMIAFDAASHHGRESDSVVMIQLPNPGRIEHALDIIRQKMG